MTEIAPQGKSSTRKIWGIAGCGCLAIALLVAVTVGAIFWGVSKSLKGPAPYRESIEAVNANPEAIAALGSPIKPGILPSGHVHISNGEGEIDYKISVSGPKGRGSIRVVGKKPASASEWIYETWQLDVLGGPSIPLSR